jgi:hypothetical protein
MKQWLKERWLKRCVRRAKRKLHAAATELYYLRGSHQELEGRINDLLDYDIYPLLVTVEGLLQPEDEFPDALDDMTEDRGGKVTWSDEETLTYSDPFEDEIKYTFKNDENLLHRFETWKEFRENDYYDGSPPPDFVTVTNEEEE